MTYKLATPINPAQMDAGSATYLIPEIIQVENYTDANGQDGGRFQGVGASEITVTIDIRRYSGVEYEEFDYSRLGDMKSIVSVAVSSLGMAIENDLNAHFWAHLENAFRPDDKTVGGQTLPAGAMRKQNIILPNLEDETATVDDTKADINKLQRFMVKLSKTFNKKALGLDKSEFMIILDPVCDVNIRNVYWNQPNSLGERVVKDDLVGYKLGAGLYYYLDPMLGNKIPAGTSFSKDKDLDTSDFVGFIIHNEAIAMPMNIRQVVNVINPDTANTRLICKYQFGIGWVRPWLCFSITKVAPKTRKGEKA